MRNKANTTEIKLEKFLFAALIALLAIHVLMYLVYSLLRIWNGIPILMGGEDIVYANSLLIAQGKPLYIKELFYEPPFAYAVYPPVYYYVCAVIFKLAGASNELGRAVSFSSIIISALLLGRLVRYRGGSASSAWISGLLFLALGPVFFWSSQNRVDNLAMALILAGLVSYYKFQKHPWAFHACNIFFIFAFYTKHTMLAAVAALFLSIFITDKKRAITLGVIWLASIALVFYIANAATNGGFHLHLSQYNGFPFVPLRSLFLATEIYKDGIFIILSALVLFQIIACKLISFETLFAVLAFLSFMATAAFSGSSINYFMEACAALSLIAGITLSSSIASQTKILVIVFLIAGLLQSALPNFKSSAGIVRNLPANIKRAEEIRAASNYFSRNFKQDDKIFFEDMELPLLAGRQPFIYAPIGYNMFVKYGVYSEDFILKNIENKQWKAIVINGQRASLKDKPVAYSPSLTARQLHAIDKYYKPFPAFNNKHRIYSMFVPR